MPERNTTAPPVTAVNHEPREMTPAKKTGRGHDGQHTSHSLLAGLPSRWLYDSPKQLLEEELRRLAAGPWQIEVIDDRILELSSELQKAQSYILTHAILKHDELTQGSYLTFSAMDSVTSCLATVRDERRRLQEFKSNIVEKSLRLVKLQLARRRAIQAYQACCILQSIGSWDITVRRYLLEDRYHDATLVLVALKNQLENSGLASFGSDLAAVSELKLTVMTCWDMLHQRLARTLGVTVIASVGSPQLPSTALRDSFKTLAYFRSTKPSAGFDMATALASQVPVATRRCLFLGAEKDWVESVPASESVHIAEICQHIPRFQIVSAVQRLLKIYWEMFLTYDRLERWCVAEQSLTASDLGELSRETWVSYLQAVCQDLHLARTSLRSRQEECLVSTLQAFQLETLPFEEFVALIRLVHRFCLEVHCFWVAKDHRTIGPAPQYDKGLVASPWTIPTMACTLTYLRRATRLYFRELHQVHMAKLRVFLCEDAWQRLPILKMGYGDLVRSPFDTSTFVFWEAHQNSSSAPAWYSGKNPFSSPIPSGTTLSNVPQATPVVSEDNISELYISNRGPVVSASSRQLCRALNDYITLGCVAPFLRLDIYFGAITLLDIMVYAVTSFFSTKEQITLLLASCSIPSNCLGGSLLYQKHAGFLLHRSLMTLRRSVGSLTSLAHSSDTHVPTLHQYPHYPIAFFDRFTISEAVCPQERLAISKQATEERLCDLGRAIRGFVISPFHRLNSPGTLWALGERVTGVESCKTSLHVLASIFLPGSEKGEALTPLNRWDTAEREYVLKVFEEKEKLTGELKTFIYTQAAEALFNLDRFINTICMYEWDANSKDIKPAIEQLRLQLQDLGRRIACCGGGSIPRSVQSFLWRCIGTYAVKACVEGLAKNTKPFRTESCADSGPPPALFVLAEDFRSFLGIVASMIEKASRNDLKSHGSRSRSPEKTLDLAYLNDYIQGHSLSGRQLLTWCKAQTNYHVKLLTQLLHKVESVASTRRAAIAELELYYVEMLRCIYDAAQQQLDLH